MSVPGGGDQDWPRGTRASESWERHGDVQTLRQRTSKPLFVTTTLFWNASHRCQTRSLRGLWSSIAPMVEQTLCSECSAQTW